MSLTLNRTSNRGSTNSAVVFSSANRSVRSPGEITRRSPAWIITVAYAACDNAWRERPRSLGLF